MEKDDKADTRRKVLAVDQMLQQEGTYWYAIFM